MGFLWKLWRDEEGQDVAEYAVMLSLMLVIVIATLHYIASGASATFSSVASTIVGQ